MATHQYRPGVPAHRAARHPVPAAGRAAKAALGSGLQPGEGGPADFETFRDALFETYASVFEHDLPPPPVARAAWTSAERLVWVGLGYEEERFYVTYSFGHLRASRRRGELHGPPLDFEALVPWCVDETSYPGLHVEALTQAFEGLLLPGLALDVGERDEEALGDALHELRGLAALSALGLLALELEREPASRLPMPVARPFRVTVAGDVELATWPEKVPTLGEHDPAVRARLVDALCRTPATRRLFRGLLAAGDGASPPDLLPALAQLL